MKLAEGELVKVKKALYGMLDSPMHWFKTYSDYHKDKLQMKPDASDPCLWYKKEDRNPSGILGLQVDDTLFPGDADFMSLEIAGSDTFPNSGRSMISKSRTRFNSIDILSFRTHVIIDQWYYTSPKHQADDLNLRRVPLHSTEFSVCRLLYDAGHPCVCCTHV